MGMPRSPLEEDKAYSLVVQSTEDFVNLIRLSPIHYIIHVRLQSVVSNLLPSTQITPAFPSSMI